MKSPSFGLPPQHLDIPDKIRVSLYVVAPAFNYEFDDRIFDHKLLKSFTDERFDKKTRAHLLSAKTTSMLSFELNPAPPILKPLETFLQYLNVGAEAEVLIRASQYLVQVTGIQQIGALDAAVTGVEIVNFAAALLAEEVGGIIVEPYSLKILETPESFTGLQTPQPGIPSLLPFLTIVQSQDPQLIRTTSLGLNRFGLPDFEVKHTPEELAAPLATLISGLAQTFFEDIVRTRKAGKDQYDIRGAQGSTRVPLKIGRLGNERALNLAFHGRQAEKNEALRQLLQDLDLV